MTLAFNLRVINLMLCTVFHYGSKISDLLKLKVANYDSEKRLISFKVKPDKLLKEDMKYIPLHEPLNNRIKKMLEYRNNSSKIKGSEPLFADHDGGHSMPISKDLLNRYFDELSTNTGEKINERSLYQSHLCFYHYLGKLNAVIDDRISNRFEGYAYIPELYTQTTLAQLRKSHFEAYRKVTASLGHDCSVSHSGIKGEKDIKIGGKRALGRDGIKTLFAYFRQSDGRDFNNCLKWITFLINYLTGSRVSEICSLTIRSIDLNLDVIKFKVKDTVKRKDTTKVIPIAPFLREQVILYLRLREDVLKSLGLKDFPFLLFTANGKKPKQLTEDEINDFYREISINCGIPYFTSHSIRYQTQTDMTAAGLDFLYANCLLSHYPLRDEIFSKYTDVSFTDFRKKYLKKIEQLLEEML